MKTKRIGILGIGNLLMKDDGFGVQCIEYLTENYLLPDNVATLDGGTAGIMLASFVEEVDILYILDTVDLQDEPGSIHRFTEQEVKAGDIQTRMSPHQVGLLEIMELSKLRNKAPEQVEMITVVPKDVTLGIGLTPGIAPKVAEAIELLIESLAQAGTIVQKKPS